MHYVITGAGQIGAQLAEDLVREGHRVTVIRRGERAPAEGAELLRGDAGDPEILTRAVRGDTACGEPAAAIFHCIHTAYDVKAWRRDLPHREAAVMDVAAGAGIPVVFPESVYAFGKGAEELIEGARIAPCSPLGRVRAELLTARAAHPARTLSVVAADLLGPTASAATSVFLQLVLNPSSRGKTAWVMGDPDAPRSVTYIPDLTRAMITAAQHADELAQDGDAVLLAPSTPPLTQRAMAASAASAAHRGEAKVRRLPWALFSAVGPFNAQFRELGRQRYLWDAPAVMTPGVLTDRFGLRSTPWEEVLSSSATLAAQPEGSGIRS
ncbi:MAG: NAD-dependent epimerase/dehydratase family protein [Galactobacter sp.]|uniref:NAD-dependent epimerase/dehydratase family protein n=1 Tax=Galactobacter sp. TaxID=2676125 RepID=UPI0025BA40C3|nr:NAD-dependent epimerase/dehydratase family protein [Galactobacter sp.]